MGLKHFAVLTSTFAIALAMTGGGFLAHARLGDTRDALTAEDGRYGKSIGSTAAVLKDSQEKTDQFKHKEIKVTTEYDKEGKTWRITYHKKELRDALMNAFMKRNGGERKWSAATKYGGTKYWVTEDKQLHAVYYGYPIHNFIIMTAEAAKAERNRQFLKGEEAKEKPEKGSAPKEEVDPLEGF